MFILEFVVKSLKKIKRSINIMYDICYVTASHHGSKIYFLEQPGETFGGQSNTKVFLRIFRHLHVRIFPPMPYPQISLIYH